MRAFTTAMGSKPCARATTRSMSSSTRRGADRGVGPGEAGRRPRLRAHDRLHGCKLARHGPGASAHRPRAFRRSRRTSSARAGPAGWPCLRRLDRSPARAGIMGVTRAPDQARQRPMLDRLAHCQRTFELIFLLQWTYDHPYTIYMDGNRRSSLAGNVHRLRDRPPETEKITVNIGYVDLGHIDLLVKRRFLLQSHRLDQDGNPQPTRHARGCRKKINCAARPSNLDLRFYSRADLEAVRAAGGNLKHSRSLGLRPSPAMSRPNSHWPQSS